MTLICVITPKCYLKMCLFSAIGGIIDSVYGRISVGSRVRPSNIVYTKNITNKKYTNQVFRAHNIYHCVPYDGRKYAEKGEATVETGGLYDEARNKIGGGHMEKGVADGLFCKYQHHCGKGLQCGEMCETLKAFCRV